MGNVCGAAESASGLHNPPFDDDPDQQSPTTHTAGAGGSPDAVLAGGIPTQGGALDPPNPLARGGESEPSTSKGQDGVVRDTPAVVNGLVSVAEPALEQAPEEGRVTGLAEAEDREGGRGAGPDNGALPAPPTPPAAATSTTPGGRPTEGSSFRQEERAQQRAMAGEGTKRNKIPPGQSFSASVLGRRTEDVESVYRLGRKLGQGQFGTTFLCVERATGRELACKSIPKRKLISAEDVDDVKREVAIMHHLAGHPNIVAIRGAYEDAAAVHIVMELCSGGELFDRIIAKGHYSERKAAQLTKTIVGVVETCHSLGVMHRDLKPENFLLSDRREDSALKATDFGLSIFFKPGLVAAGESFTDVVGSPYYVAPEVLRRNYGPEIDVWSAGVIVYILLSGVPPFWAETEQGIFEAVLRGELDFDSDPWPLISEHAKDLIRRMLEPDPKRRLTAYQVLCHPWVSKDGVAPDKPLDSAVLSRLKQFTATNKLKKMALRVIAESMSEEEIAGLKEMFKMIDTDNSGTITFEELKAGLHRIGNKLNDAEVREIMEAADVDNNGSIDYKEFLAATLHLNKIEREETLFAAFRHFDKDNSGNISVEELQQACREFNMDESSIVDIMKDVDTNNDGHIDYNEFVTMMRMGNGGVGRKSLHSRSIQAGGILSLLVPRSPVSS